MDVGWRITRWRRCHWCGSHKSGFKGTRIVIASDTSCKDGNVRFTTIRFLVTLIWSKLWKILSFFQLEKCLFLCAWPLLLINKKCVSHFRRQTANWNKHSKEEKKMINNQTKSCQGFPCKSGIVTFAWRNTWNYAYSPFKEIF